MHVFIHIHVHKHTYVLINMRWLDSIYTNTHMYSFMYMYINTSMNVSIYIFIYAFINTHTYLVICIIYMVINTHLYPLTTHVCIDSYARILTHCINEYMWTSMTKWYIHLRTLYRKIWNYPLQQGKWRYTYRQSIYLDVSDNDI